MTIELFEGERIASLAFSPDGTRLAAGMRSGEVHVWDLTKMSLDLASIGIDDTDWPQRPEAEHPQPIEVVELTHEPPDAATTDNLD